MRTRKHPADEIDNAINEIKARGYLREAVYAETRVIGFMYKGYSPDYIRQKLAQEHLTVTNEEIENIFSEHRTSSEDQIEQLVRKKMRNKSNLDYEEENKILRYLISKGHDFDISKKVIKSIAQEVASHLS